MDKPAVVLPIPGNITWDVLLFNGGDSGCFSDSCFMSRCCPLMSPGEKGKWKIGGKSSFTTFSSIFVEKLCNERVSYMCFETIVLVSKSVSILLIEKRELVFLKFIYLLKIHICIACIKISFYKWFWYKGRKKYIIPPVRIWWVTVRNKKFRCNNFLHRSTYIRVTRAK